LLAIFFKMFYTLDNFYFLDLNIFFLINNFEFQSFNMEVLDTLNCCSKKFFIFNFFFFNKTFFFKQYFFLNNIFFLNNSLNLFFFDVAVI
jgi:hypothetical protein